MRFQETAAGDVVQTAPPSKKAPEARRVLYIDALRGVAALGVAWFHLFTQNGGDFGDLLPRWFLMVSVWGRFGVQLFFLLTGFVLTYTLLNKNAFEKITSVGRYFIRRSVRLDPAYWFVLIVFIALKPLLDSVTGGDYDLIGEPVNFYNLFANFLYFLPLHPPSTIMPVVWTLVLEVQFYLLFALCLFLIDAMAKRYPVHKDRIQLTVLMLLSALAALWPLGIARYADGICLPYLYCFMLGLSACMAVQRINGWTIVCAANVVVVAAGAVMTKNSYVIASLFFFFVIVIVGRSRILRDLLERRVFLSLGSWSYTIYLTHMIVGALVIESLKHFFPAGQNVVFLYVTCGLLSVVLFSALVFRFVETPSIDLSKKVRIR